MYIGSRKLRESRTALQQCGQCLSNNSRVIHYNYTRYRPNGVHGVCVFVKMASSFMWTRKNRLVNVALCTLLDGDALIMYVAAQIRILNESTSTIPIVLYKH